MSRPNSTRARCGDTVRVHYIGSLSDGSIFDSSRSGDPIELTLGESDFAEAFEESVIGLAPGETRTVVIAAEEAYGERDGSLVLDVDRSYLPDSLPPIHVGSRLEVSTPSGVKTEMFVARATEQSVRLDANHPLAGEDLRYDVELIEVRPAVRPLPL